MSLELADKHNVYVEQKEDLVVDLQLKRAWVWTLGGYPQSFHESFDDMNFSLQPSI